MIIQERLLAGFRPHGHLGRAEIEAIVDELGDVGAALDSADPAELEQLYSALHLEMVYDPRSEVVYVSLRPIARDSKGPQVIGSSLPVRL